MKSLIYTIKFIIIISVLSCGQNSFEKQLNGKWYETKNEHAIWYFYPDSLVITDELNNVIKWNASESKIEFEYPSYYLDSTGKPNEIKDKIIINYKLSTNKDSLFGTLKNRFGTHEFDLLKAENYSEYLNKKYDIQFSLPKDTTAKPLETKAIFGLKVLMGVVNNTIIEKTELSENLNQLESDVTMFKDSIETNGRPEVDGFDKFYDNRFHLRVFADKSISDAIIVQKFPIKLKATNSDSIPVKIYRMYENFEKDNPDILKAKRIQTIAKTENKS